MESSGSEEVGPEEGGSNFTVLIIMIVNFIVLPGLLCLYCKFDAYCQGGVENLEMIERPLNDHDDYQDQVIKPFE